MSTAAFDDDRPAAAVAMDDGRPQPPPGSKRQRLMQPWEAFLAENSTAARGKSVLAELFGGGGDGGPHGAAHRRGDVERGDRGENVRRWGQQPGQGNGFFTFRLEHREGGALARYRGEERMVLFRSDRPGAIAKVIYSSEGPKFVQSGGVGQRPTDEEAELRQMAQAKIHVLDVKEPYRGRDLGGLLFSEAVRSLRERYTNHPTGGGQHGAVAEASPLSSSVRCQLDAEEDVRRHNKLIGFYEKLGCSIKPKAKIQYLNNNDGETYRKIPMQIALRPTPTQTGSPLDPSEAAAECNKVGNANEKRPRHTHHIHTAKSLVGLNGGFLPVNLVEASGTRVSFPVPCGRRVDWLLVDDGEGFVQFRTTQGDRIVVTHDGRVRRLSCDDSDLECEDEGCPCCGCPIDDWGKFSLCRIPDTANVVSDSESSGDEGGAISRAEARRKELWMLQTSHGTFLATDPSNHCLSCTTVPVFWQANDDDLSLTCTTDTPPRRMHYRTMWLRQTVEHVTMMRSKFLGFNLRSMTLREALDMAKSIPCHPWRAERGRSGPSLRTFCFQAAETLRMAGHPDWMQLVALVHELGRVVSLIDVQTAAEAQDTGFDWTISCRSRVVGCRAPGRVSFGEFRYICRDEADERYSTPLGMYNEHCGLSNVMLAWTGPEYMHYMLKHNGTSIPEEGFAMVRLFSLGDWHSCGEYGNLANDDDDDMRPFISDFDQLRRHERKKCEGEDLSDEDCSRLWEKYYSNIAEKYNFGGELKW